MEYSSVIQKIASNYNLDLSQELPIRIPRISRMSLPLIFKKMRYKRGAEIGVQFGGFSEYICRRLIGVELHCVDIWSNYPGYNSYKNSYEEARNRLSKYGCNLIRKFSMDAVNDFEDKSLDFVYIDANHDFRHVVDDIDSWSRKVRSGGIVSGHDYSRYNPSNPKPPVVCAVDAYTEAHRIKPWFVTGMDVKTTEEKSNGARSWFWVKE